MKSKRPQLEKALSGKLREHHRFMLGSLLRQLEFLTEEIATLDREVEERMRPFQAALAMLDRVPGIGLRTAECIIAELGTERPRTSLNLHPTAARTA
jgi:transposase